jgi:aspartate/glutamate racemase
LALGSQQTMTASFYAQLTKNRSANPMSTQTALQTKIVQEIANFQKTMVELHLLKKVSRDLQKFKMMTQLKKFD